VSNGSIGSGRFILELERIFQPNVVELTGAVQERKKILKGKNDCNVM